MIGLDALQAAQFITIKGKRFVLISAEDWESLIEWLEMVDDKAIAQDTYARLAEADFDRRKAGWIEWEAFGESLG